MSTVADFEISDEPRDWNEWLAEEALWDELDEQQEEEAWKA